MKAIKTVYLGATNCRGSRIKATDCDRNHFTMHYDYELTDAQNHERAAAALARKMKWRGKTVMGSFPQFNVHVFIS